MPAPRSLFNELKRFEAPMDDADWAKHEALTSKLKRAPKSRATQRAVLGLLARHSAYLDDAALMPFVHWLETTKGYEDDLLASLAKEPSTWTVRLAHRLINGGCRVDELLDALERVAASSNVDDACVAAKDALTYFKKQGLYKGPLPKKRRAPKKQAAATTNGLHVAEFIGLIGRRLDDPAFVELSKRTRVVKEKASSLFLTMPDVGVQLSFDGKCLSAVICKLSEADDSMDGAVYRGPMPSDVGMGMPRKEVRSRLGKPTQSGDAFDKFVRGSALLCVRYEADKLNELWVERAD